MSIELSITDGNSDCIIEIDDSENESSEKNSSQEESSKEENSDSDSGKIECIESNDDNENKKYEEYELQNNNQESSVKNEVEDMREKTTQEDNENEQVTLFSIIFNNKTKYNQLKSCVINSLTTNIEKEFSIKVEFVNNDNFCTLFGVEKNKNNENIPNEEEDTNKFNFEIDITPQRDGNEKIPVYKRSVTSVLEEPSKKRKIDLDEQEWTKSNACFNCLGNHSLRDCTKPRDSQRINKNRKSFSLTNRYHLDAQKKYPHLKPGVISEDLKKALGLRRCDLPPYIYKMRVLGYPPGWLEEAKIPYSGLTLFDSEGNRVLESDEEEGEIDEDKCKYDVEKIINFPGFNVKPERNFIDDYQYYGVPPMLPVFSKKEFIKSLENNNFHQGHKRKKLKNLSTNLFYTDISEQAVEDMEIEDVDKEDLGEGTSQSFNPPLPSTIPPALPEQPPPPPLDSLKKSFKEINKNEFDNNDTDSLSLAELEKEQMELLKALETNSEKNSDAQCDNSNLTHSEEINKLNDSNIHENNSEENNIVKNNIEFNSIKNSATEDENENSETKNDSMDSAKLVLGTPILKFSPFDKIPKGENFSEGVSELINFENLADSTGKYEKMKKVLKKVRKVVTQLNMDN